MSASRSTVPATWKESASASSAHGGCSPPAPRVSMAPAQEVAASRSAARDSGGTSGPATSSNVSTMPTR